MTPNAPPVSRVNKPISPQHKELEIYLYNSAVPTPGTVITEEISVSVVDNVESLPPSVSLDVELPDRISFSDQINPIPKPERGNYTHTPKEEDDFVIVEQINDTLIFCVTPQDTETEASIKVESVCETEGESKFEPETTVGIVAKPTLKIDLVSDTHGAYIPEKTTLNR